MRHALARKTNFESFARSVFYAIDFRRFFLDVFFFFYRITSRITSKNFVHPLDILKFNFLLKNTGNRKMPSTTTKYLGFKCQPYFSPQLSLNFNLERLSPCYWPYNCDVAFCYLALSSRTCEAHYYLQASYFILHSLTLECIFSLLFSVHFLRNRQRELV